MGLNDIIATINGCNSQALDSVTQAFWNEYSKGLHDDVTAQALTEAVEARRKVLRSSRYHTKPMPLLKAPKRPIANRERLASRRRLAMCGAMPPALGCHFTCGETAALTVIIAEIKRKGSCQLYVGQIAHAASVSIRIVQQALAVAERLGILKVQRRPRYNCPHLSNLITIQSPELAAWISKVSSLWGRVQKSAYNILQVSNQPIKTIKLQAFRTPPPTYNYLKR
jgi:hypothetical protein